MITIQSAMFVALGVFLAGFVAFIIAPYYRRRAARLAIDELKRSMPLTESEIRADKDRLRAQHAVAVHRLETRLEEANLSAARQMVDINRRDAAISALEGEIAKNKAALEEHENARRVLEQTITDRLPRVEHRLTEAKKLLFQRDREITTLTQSGAKQAQALEEATQINTQLRDEIHRLNATLTTRAARNREPLAADSRFDEEVALRAELESLRAKARDQAAMIDRLQGVLAKSGARAETLAGTYQEAAAGSNTGVSEGGADIARLHNDLAEAEVALKAARGAAEAGQAGQALVEAEVRTLRALSQDQTTEIARLKAALKAYEAEDVDDRALKESKIAMKARLSALQAQSDQQSATIQSLRAEVAATNEKFARQAQHYVEEMRRLGAGTMPASGPSRRDSYEAQKKKSLAERINAPRPLAKTETTETSDAVEAAEAKKAETTRPKQDSERVTGFLRALGGEADASSVKTNGSNEASAEKKEPASATAAAEAKPAEGAPEKKPARRPGLLERITGLEKPAASNS